MSDLSITLTTEAWTDILVDFDAFERAMEDSDEYGWGLEEGSKTLREALRFQGVEI